VTLLIEISAASPKVVVNGLNIVSAPTVNELHAVLGPPSRIDGGTPPVGHRNNQGHYYDDFGFCFVEHHYTRRATHFICVFDNVESRLGWKTIHPFLGRLIFEDVEMPPGGSEREFIKASPIQFQQEWAKVWVCRFEGYCIWIDPLGAKLPSGKRSKSRRVTDLSVSWPHDDWAEPAIDDKTSIRTKL
jgi:hypothetical protein